MNSTEAEVQEPHLVVSELLNGFPIEKMIKSMWGQAGTRLKSKFPQSPVFNPYLLAYFYCSIGKEIPSYIASGNLSS